MTPRFRIQTVDGRAHTQGDPNPTGLGDPDAVLTDYTEDDGWIVLHFGLLDVAIPECRVQHIAEVNSPPGTTTSEENA